jgi:hypothetical protein
MSAAVTGKDEIALSELVNYSLVVGPRSHMARIKLEEVVAERGIKLQVEQELEPGALRRSLVVHKGCYTVATFGMFAEDIVLP